MSTIPTIEPECLTAGDTLKFKRKFGDYEPGTWTMNYYMVIDGTRITFASTDNGDGYHLIDVAPAATATWPPGTYKYQATITDGTDRYTLYVGTLRVLPDYDAQDDGLQAESAVKQTLDALRAAILGRASKTQLGYSIGNRSISEMSHGEIREMIDRYEWLYKQELDAERRTRGASPKSVIRFRL